MRKNDLYLIFMLLALAALLHFFLLTQEKAGSLYLEIRQDAKIVQRVKYSALTAAVQQTLETSHGKIEIEFKPGRGVRIVSSPCPDKLCVHQGYINKGGQAILCLPEKILVSLISDQEEGAPDAVLR